MGSTSTSAGGQTSVRSFDFGATHVVQPKGRHEATIVWLHGVADDGYIWSHILGGFRLHNIKWICPTAPLRPASTYYGCPGPAWFDPKDLPNSQGENVPVDLEGLNASAAHVADLLSTEPPDVKLGIGGFSIGAAAALYTSTCYILSETGNRIQFLDNLTSIIVLSGWLPCYKPIESQTDRLLLGAIVTRVQSLYVFMCHGTEDEVVRFIDAESSASCLHEFGFKNLTFLEFDGLGHDTCAQEMKDLCSWLTDKLELQGW